MESFIQHLFAERIGGAAFGRTDTVYKFEKIKRAKRAAVAAHPNTPIIDMGVGEPDAMAYPIVVESLQAAAARPENRGYADNGGARLKTAAATYMRSVFGADLDPESEIVHSIGSKSALSLLPACFINPGDIVLMTTPGYPVLGTHAAYYGGVVHALPLTRENNFLPDLDGIPPEVLKKAKILVLNYPNNPTGASATEGFFLKAIEWAKTHNILLIQDAAYAALVFPGEKPLSLLSLPGGKDVGIELHSLSKGFNMTGWRIGFVAGNPLAVKAYASVKDNSDSGQFLAIQEAAATALEHPSITAEIAAKYDRRMGLLVDTLQALGFPAEKPRGSFFLYVPAPRQATREGVTEIFENAEAFSQWLIRKHLISTVPWDEAGAFIRFSVTFSAPDTQEEAHVMEVIRQRLAGWTFLF